MDIRYQGQKIQIPATRIKALAADFANQDNAKVKVQYIQNHQIIEKDAVNHDANDVEAENVEYLDESTSDEQPTKLNAECVQNRGPFRDTFYANAIHCLIDLYKRRYQEMKGKTPEQIRAMCVWDRITEDMNECLFRFNCSQIRHKFRQLRGQYFGVASLEEADAFEYFDQLHDLYQDKFIDGIAAGVGKRSDQTQEANTYPDEELQLEDEPAEVEQQEVAQLLSTEPDEHNYQAAAAQEVVVETHHVANDEIAHKENEFIDMVEKGLQSIVEGNAGENFEEEATQEIVLQHDQEEIAAHEEVSNCAAVTSQLVPPVPVEFHSVVIKREHQQEEEPKPPVTKRLKVEPQVISAMPSTHVLRLHVAPEKSLKPIGASHSAVPVTAVHEKTNGEMTLAAYNLQQERRHQEKLTLLRQSLAIQERALEIHRHLMEELIKRL